jgi:hypothetical protein
MRRILPWWRAHPQRMSAAHIRMQPQTAARCGALWPHEQGRTAMLGWRRCTPDLTRKCCGVHAHAPLIT